MIWYVGLLEKVKELEENYCGIPMPLGVVKESCRK